VRGVCVVALVAALLAGGCGSPTRTGSGVGGSLGALIGALTFGDRTQGAAVGASVGMVAGYAAGRLGRDEALRAKPKASPNQATAWVMPESESSLDVRVSPARAQGGTAVREVSFDTVGPDGRRESVTNTAARNPDGTWSLAR